MRKFTDKEILDRVAGLSTFRGFPNGPMDVWVRSSADEFDRFDDRAFTYECRGPGSVPQFVMARTGTTNAGAYGLLHFDRYNRAGCAVLRSETIVYGSHRYGLHKGLPAYVQAKPFPYYRDADRDRRIDESGPLYYDIIGANLHRAGVNSTVIGRWSTACLVTATLADFERWLRLMNKRPLTLCILKERAG